MKTKYFTVNYYFKDFGEPTSKMECKNAEE